MGHLMVSQDGAAIWQLYISKVAGAADSIKPKTFQETLGICSESWSGEVW